MREVFVHLRFSMFFCNQGWLFHNSVASVFYTLFYGRQLMKIMGSKKNFLVRYIGLAQFEASKHHESVHNSWSCLSLLIGSFDNGLQGELAYVSKLSEKR